jgi:hypothetical protein
MSEPRRWVLGVKDLILGVVTGPSVSIQEAEQGIPVLEAEPVEKHIKDLEAQLAEANWVLRFYGCVDSYFDGSVGLENSAIEDDMGAKANQYLEKWKVGK